jgi:L-ascorbate metabolism protein UlaG (beta-lactamase superfamily)
LAAFEAMSLLGVWDHRRPAWVDADADCPTRAASPAAGVLHVGHSTHLIRLRGVQVLTDPWFYDPAFGALVHERAAACAIEQLGGCAGIVISHGHPDHFDTRALDRWSTKSTTPVLVGDSQLVQRVQRLGFAQVTHLATWETHSIGPLRIHAVPAVHDVSEQGFVLETTEHSVYFAGDTGAHGAFAAIAERYRPSMALLPVDGGRLRGSSVRTLTPSEAVTAAQQLQVKGVCPSHVDAVFSDWLAENVLAEQIVGALAAFQRELAQRLPQVAFQSPRPGQWLAL